jgi:hypothetical protein
MKMSSEGGEILETAYKYGKKNAENVSSSACILGYGTYCSSSMELSQLP